MYGVRFQAKSFENRFAHSRVTKALPPKGANSTSYSKTDRTFIKLFKDCLRKHFQVISVTLSRVRLDYAPLCNCHKVSNFRDNIL